jgi:hypothetical protein
LYHSNRPRAPDQCAHSNCIPTHRVLPPKDQLEIFDVAMVGKFSSSRKSRATTSTSERVTYFSRPLGGEVGFPLPPG